jgi:dipeptidyl aminopeptidase/acylaminoacyl peptidase
VTLEDFMNPLNHIQAHRYLQAAVDNRLESRARAALAEHLNTCPECRSYAKQVGVLERDLRGLFHKQWDTASERSINLLPGIRARYQRKVMNKQLVSLASTLVTIGLVLGLLLLLNWFLTRRQSHLPAGDQTPTPTLSTPTHASPTPSVNSVTPTQSAGDSLMGVIPAGLLAFTSSHEELGDLYLIRTDGSGQARLFDDNLSLSLSPAWSPDGSKLAFVSNRDGNFEIYTVNADGAQPTRLTDEPATDTDPSWSPDGKFIAFVSDRSGYKEVYVMDARGSNVNQLTRTQASNTHPTWSPDSASIAFASNRDGYWQIYRMNADGSEATNLSDNPASDEQEPAWSPDGKRIAFTSQKVETLVQEIYVMNPDGSGRVRLTGDDSSSDQTTSDYSPAWSPDSQWIAFWSHRDNPVYGDIYILSVNDPLLAAESLVRLTIQGGSQPAWKP